MPNNSVYRSLVSRATEEFGGGSKADIETVCAYTAKMTAWSPEVDAAVDRLLRSRRD